MSRSKVLIGIGQVGCAIADAFARADSKSEDKAYVLALDTDERTLEGVSHADVCSLAFNMTVADVLDELDLGFVQGFFPCDRERDHVEYFETLTMSCGSSGWRMKALLALYYGLAHPSLTSDLRAKLDAVFSQIASEGNDRVRVHIVASLAGGTGSGLFLPIALFLKKYLAENYNFNVYFDASLILPEVTESCLGREQAMKAKANAFAALAELDAITANAQGKCEPFELMLGCEEDPVWGLIYDGRDERFRSPSAAPFSEVFLYNRVPRAGVLSAQIIYFADAIRSVFTSRYESDFTSGVISDSGELVSIYSGLSSVKTLYCPDSAAEYISARYIGGIADAEWLGVYTEALKEIKREKNSRLSRHLSYNGDASDIASAIVAAYGRLSENEDSSLATLSELAEKRVNRYVRAVSDRVHGITATDSSKSIEAFVASARSETLEVGFFGACALKKELVRYAEEFKQNLTDYYVSQIGRDEEAAAFGEAVLADSELSVMSLFKDESGRYDSPRCILTLLALIYKTLDDDFRTDVRVRFEQTDKPEEAVAPLLDISVPEDKTECRYASYGAGRFRELLTGNKRHLSGRACEKKVLASDMEYIYGCVSRVSEARYIASALDVLGGLIEKSMSFLALLSEAVEDRRDRIDALLTKNTAKSGNVYAVGTSADEKKHHYDRFLESVAEGDTLSAIGSFCDSALGGCMADALIGESEDEQSDPAQALAETLSRVDSETEATVSDTEYIKTLADKDVLEVLLGQNGKHGTDTYEFALSKAFLAGNEPLMYELRDDNARVSRHVLAVIPSDILKRLENEGCEDALKYIQLLMAEAGESYGVACSEEGQSDKEIRVLRLVRDLRLNMLDNISTSSHPPVYYKAYKGSRILEREQSTLLWNPHITPFASDIPFFL